MGTPKPLRVAKQDRREHSVPNEETIYNANRCLRLDRVKSFFRYDVSASAGILCPSVSTAKAAESQLWINRKNRSAAPGENLANRNEQKSRGASHDV
jgi:hypothetical protein